jgi:hypothetical protein
MALREILAVFGVRYDTSQLDKGNAKVEQGTSLLRSFGSVLAGAFAVDRLRAFTFGMVEQADAIGDQAQLLGISTKALQEWQFAAGFVELQGEALTGIFTRLSVNANKADEATKGVAETLKDLGVDVKNSNGEFKSAGQLFEETGLALGTMGDKTKATALAVQLFGRQSAAKVIQLFKGGKPAIEAFRKEFEELGGAFSEEFIAAAGEVDDNMKRLNVSWTTAKVRIAGLLLPALNATVQTFGKLARAGADVFAKTSFGPMILGLGALAAATKLLSATAPLLKHWKLALAAILAEDVLTFLRGGDSVIGDVIDWMFGPGSQEKVRAWVNAVGKEVQGFFTDLAQHPEKFADDVQVALRQVSKDLRSLPGGEIWSSMFDFGMLAIDVLTGGWSNFSVKVSAFGNGMMSLFKLVWSEIKFAGLEAAATLSDGWTNAINGILSAVGKLPGLGSVSEGLKPGGALSEVKQLHAKETAAIKTEGARAVAPLSGNTSNNTVTVAQGPQTFNFYGNDTAAPASIARVAGNSVNNANRAAAAAIVQRGSKQ